MTKKFQKKIEDFVCENCGQSVKGGGYNNHCPRCLYSKHVDINPGDRANSCGGLMKPIGSRPYGHGWRIIHQCLKCGAIKENKLWPEDNFDVLVEIAKNITSK